MNELLQAVFDLLRVRGGPQRLPASWPLTNLVIALFIAEEVLTSQGLGGSSDAGQALLSAALQFSIVAGLLKLRGYPERLGQTLLALAATGIVVGLLAYLLFLQADPSRNQPVLALLWFVVFGWNLAVNANIYRHALVISLSQGVLVAVVLLAISYVAMELVFK